MELGLFVGVSLAGAYPEQLFTAILYFFFLLFCILRQFLDLPSPRKKMRFFALFWLRVCRFRAFFRVCWAQVFQNLGSFSCSEDDNKPVHSNKMYNSQLLIRFCSNLLLAPTETNFTGNLLENWKCMSFTWSQKCTAASFKRQTKNKTGNNSLKMISEFLFNTRLAHVCVCCCICYIEQSAFYY